MLVKDKKALTDILGRLNKGISFIEKENIIICSNSLSAYPDSFKDKDGKHLNPITKFTGSDLMQLKNAAYELTQLLENN